MSASDLFVSVVAPLNNDADIVAGFVNDLVEVLDASYRHYEVILVDDGSGDGTEDVLAEVLRNVPGLRVIPLSRPFGQEIAISAGLDSAIGDYVVVMLPASDPPAAIPEMVARARAGVGVVFGVHQDRSGDPVAQRLGRRLFHAMASAGLDVPIHRNATHFRVLSREAVNALTRIRSQKRYLQTLTHHVGYGDEPYVYRPEARRAPPRRRSLASLVALASDIVVTNTTRPLRAVSWMALFGSAALGAFAVYVVAVYLLRDQVSEGWATVAGPLAVSFCMLFLVLGVMGLYLGRLLEDRGDGPLYHSLDERNSPVPAPHEERKNVVSDPTTDG